MDGAFAGLLAGAIEGGGEEGAAALGLGVKRAWEDKDAE